MPKIKNIKLIATDKKYRTQEQCISYFNNLKIPMLSSADLLKAPKEELPSLRKDMKDRWIVTSTQIDYSKNTITHYTGSKWAKTIQLKSIPVCRPTYLKALLETEDGLDYARALLDSKKAKKDEIIAISEALSGKPADKIRFWTPDHDSRVSKPLRSVDFYYNLFDGRFVVYGNYWFVNDYGLSRGVSVGKKNSTGNATIVKSNKTTQELIDKFDNLCEKYSCEDINVKILKKGIREVIDNWSG